jgi:hypothetical protein
MEYFTLSYSGRTKIVKKQVTSPTAIKLNQLQIMNQPIKESLNSKWIQQNTNSILS